MSDRFEAGMVAFERVVSRLFWPLSLRLLIRRSPIVPAGEVWIRNGNRIDRIINIGEPAGEREAG